MWECPFAFMRGRRELRLGGAVWGANMGQSWNGEVEVLGVGGGDEYWNVCGIGEGI